MIDGSEDGEVAFLLIPLVFVSGVEDELLGDGILHNYAHLLDLLSSGVHHVEPGCLVLEAEDEGIFLLVLELWAQLLLNTSLVFLGMYRIYSSSGSKIRWLVLRSIFLFFRMTLPWHTCRPSRGRNTVH